MRDIRADYKAAYIAEYEAYKRARRDKDAATVAKILKDHYGHDVERAVPVDDTEKRQESQAQESTKKSPTTDSPAAAAKKTTAQTPARKTTAMKPQSESK